MHIDLLYIACMKGIKKRNTSVTISLMCAWLRLNLLKPYKMEYGTERTVDPVESRRVKEISI